MYPTVLNLLQLEDYRWVGLGQSILDPEKKGCAVSPQMQVESDDTTPEDIDFKKEAYTISDEIIRLDYFGKRQQQHRM